MNLSGQAAQVDLSVGKKPLLDVSGLCAYYDDLQALYDVNLQVMPGEIVSILGANAAGKSTLLRALSGLIHRTGKLLFDGHDLTQRSAHEIVDLGLVHVPEGRELFPFMTVEDASGPGTGRVSTDVEVLGRRCRLRAGERRADHGRVSGSLTVVDWTRGASHADLAPKELAPRIAANRSASPCSDAPCLPLPLPLPTPTPTASPSTRRRPEGVDAAGCHAEGAGFEFDPAVVLGQ